MATGGTWPSPALLMSNRRRRPSSSRASALSRSLRLGFEYAVLVSEVNEGGPAERAGVQRGDVIVAVDRQPTAGQSIEQIVGRIRGPSGTPVELLLQRGGQQFALTVRRKLLAL